MHPVRMWCGSGKDLVLSKKTLNELIIVKILFVPQL
jgi:hypothetical protein